MPAPAMFALDGRVALVTGSSRGLGWALAEALADAGAHVVLNGREPERLRERLSFFHFCNTGHPSEIRGLQGMLEHRLRMRRGSRSECLGDAFIELLGVRAVADEVKETAWIEIVGQMQKVQLLANDSHHPSQRGSDGIGPGNAALIVQLIGQPSAYPMRLTFHTGNPMPHREEQRAIR